MIIPLSDTTDEKEEDLLEVEEELEVDSFRVAGNSRVGVAISDWMLELISILCSMSSLNEMDFLVRGTLFLFAWAKLGNPSILLSSHPAVDAVARLVGLLIGVL